MRALIVDDVEFVAESLKQLIVEFCEGVDVIGIANSADDAIKIINNEKPELVFLDIQMPGKSGFDLLNSFEKVDFAVIFVTAYNEFAIKAVRFGAIDYLLKPVDIEDLKEAIERAKIKTEEKALEIKNLLNNIENPGDSSNTLIINSERGYTLIKISEIVRVEADGNYSYIYTDEGKRFVSSKNLKLFEKYLENYNFVRIHNSHVINLAKIDNLNTKDNLEVIMLNGEILPISVRKKQDLIKKFDRF
jgi:two-component system, LytTR family, response regulator